jgi:hypothetical protein
MDIRPYRSGRKGLHVPLGAVHQEHLSRAGRDLVGDETLALDARIVQEDAYCHVSSGSLRYLLLLSGVMSNIHEMDDHGSVHVALNALAPGACPGTHGPIAILLIL